MEAGDVSNVNRMRNRRGGPRRRVKRGNASVHGDVQGCMEKTARYVKSFISRNENNMKSGRAPFPDVPHFRITVSVFLDVILRFVHFSTVFS